MELPEKLVGDKHLTTQRFNQGKMCAVGGNQSRKHLQGDFLQ
jgi:hypothetical protein